jgi:hypothetical protein
VVNRIEHGEGRQEDLDLLNSVADNIMGRTICALGDAAAMPVRGMLKHFWDEFAYHVEHKHCMVGHKRQPEAKYRCNAHGRTRERKWFTIMVEIEIDGKKVEVPEGSMVIRLRTRRHVHSALLLSQETVHRGQLPHVPGRSREGAQAVPACATPVTAGMIVHNPTRP